MIYPLFAFLGAFALFFFELHLGKLLTPRFGGGAEVWLFCLVYFQLVLLAGYGYGHLVSTRLSGRQRKHLHGALLVLALALAFHWWRQGGVPWLPTIELGHGSLLDLLLPLALGPTVALVLLSGTSPLVHRWFTEQEPGRSPFRLYAWSNIGSVAGLLAYPIVFETTTSNRFHGGFLWAAMAVLLALTFAIPTRDRPISPQQEEGNMGPQGGRVLGWIGYAMLGSAAMVGVSGILNEQMGSFPLLWSLPLLAYLLSFILTFDARFPLFGVEYRWVWITVAAISLWGMEFFSGPGIHVPLRMISSAFALVLSVGLLCHGALYDARPPSKQATSFLFASSAGGALGGLVMAWVVPNTLTRLFELDLLSIALAVTLMVSARRHRWRRGWVHGVSGVTLAMLSLGHLVIEASRPGAFFRNLFGILIVSREGTLRTLNNLRTVHGTMDPKQPQNPLLYYSPASGFGHAMRIQQAMKPSLDVGVIGLGVGSCAAYVRAADRMTVYEINPEVIRLAGPQSLVFPILHQAKGFTRVQLGDGRLLLEEALRASGGRPLYDLLLVDAFAGDAIPWHLATKEALNLYLRSLKPDGVLVFHVTTPYPVDLLAMRGLRDAPVEMAYVWDIAPVKATEPSRHGSSYYLLVSPSPAVLQDPLMQAQVTLRMKQGKIWVHGEINPALTQALSGPPWVDNKNSLTLMLQMNRQALKIAKGKT